MKRQNINNSKGKRRKRGRRRRPIRAAAVLVCLTAVIGAGAVGGIVLWGQAKDYVGAYEMETYNRQLYQGELFASNLCVASGEVSLDGFTPDSELHAAGLFDLNQEQVLCGYKIFDRLYPASTTKTMTAYIALKYGNLDDQITVSANATDFNWDESVCGLQTGDTLTLYDLLCGLMLQSGNDAGTAIAEYISGSEEAFAELMNEEAASLGATGTHYVNPHGLHDENHYTTAYDLYLIFNAALKNKKFLEIISLDSYSASITGADGTVRTQVWEPTNYYSAGLATPPDGVRVVGGKTGTTDEAGNCVVLYDLDSENQPYISVIMGAPDKDRLYIEMNEMYTAGILGTTG